MRSAESGHVRQPLLQRGAFVRKGAVVAHGAAIAIVSIVPHDVKNQGVVPARGLLHGPQETPDLMVRMRDEAREDFHLPCGDLSFVHRQRFPCWNLLRARRQSSGVWNDAESFLALEDLLSQ